MPTSRCLFCQHANPASAKFCNECGSGLRLQPCERCDAINDRDAAHCHHCGVALAPSPPIESASGAPEADGLATLVDEVPLPVSVAPAEQRTSVDRAFEVLERDRATLDRARPAGRTGGAASWPAAAQHDEHAAAAGGEHDLTAVRLQPFWRVRASRRAARPLAAIAAAAVAFAIAVAGYLHTSPQAPSAGLVVAKITQSARDIAGSASIDTVRSMVRGADDAPGAREVTAKQDGPLPAPATVPKQDEPAATPAVVSRQDNSAPAPAVVPKQDEPAPAPSLMAKQDEPAPAPAVMAKQDEPAPAPSVMAKQDEPANASAVIAQADDPAAAASQSPVRAATPKRRARANAARTPAVSATMFDAAPTTTAPGTDAVPVPGPCTASVAALGLCARGSDAAAR